jgi:hypothetical protein
MFHKLRIDSPTRHVLERNHLADRYYDLQDIEMIPSPLLSTEIPGDEDVIVSPFNEDSQETPVSSNVLGVSKFRRKHAANTDVSSPINPGPSVSVDSQISRSPFDTYDLTQPTSFQLPPTLSPPQYQPSISATIPTKTRARDYLEARTSSGKTLKISKKPLWEKLQAGTAHQAAKRAQKEAYYGVDIHRLLDRINEEKGIFGRRTAKERRRMNLTAEVEGQRIVNDASACGEFD